MSDLSSTLPTTTARKYVSYVVGFGVAVPVGMAPFLGKYNIPGFSALLGLFPKEFQETLIPTSAFLMGIVAVAIQFYTGDKIAVRSLQLRFKLGVRALVAGLFLLTGLHSFFVPNVPRGDGKELFVIGWTRKAHCECIEADASNEECIQGLAYDLEPCWSTQSRKQVELSLKFSYLLLTGGFGALIGLLMNKEIALDARRAAKNASRT